MTNTQAKRGGGSSSTFGGGPTYPRSNVKGKSCNNKLAKQFKRIDVYGEKISLTYQGNETFRTTPGASMSLIVIAVILAYAIYRGFILVTLGDTNVFKKSLMTDLNELGPFKPQEFGFDIAFGIDKPLDPSYGFMRVRLVDFYYTNQTNPDGSNVRIKGRTNLDIDLCSKVGFDFPDQEAVKAYGIMNLYCIKDKSSWRLNGNFYSYNFTYLEIRLNRCVNSSSSSVICKDYNDITNFFSTATFSLPYVNTYFDFNDYDSQVKYFIDDTLFWEIDTTVINKANVYVQKNEASLQDDYLQLGQSNDFNFYQVQNQRTYFDNYIDAEGYYCGIFLRIDNRYDIFERQIYSVLTYLGDIGGLEQSIFLMGMLLVSFFTQRIFNASVLKRIYQVKKYDQLAADVDKENKNDEFDEPFGNNSIQGSQARKDSYPKIEAPQDLNIYNYKISQKDGETRRESRFFNQHQKKQKLKDAEKMASANIVNTEGTRKQKRNQPIEDDQDCHRKQKDKQISFKSKDKPQISHSISNIISSDGDDENPKVNPIDRRQYAYKVETLQSQKSKEEGGNSSMKNSEKEKLKRGPSKESNTLEIRNYAKQSTKGQSVKDSIISKKSSLKHKLENLDEDSDELKDSKLLDLMSPQPSNEKRMNMIMRANSQQPAKKEYSFGGLTPKPSRKTVSETRKAYPSLNNSVFQQKVKNEKMITMEDINQILVDLINRARFKYTSRNILEYISKCLCLRKKSSLKYDENNKKHFLFLKAKDKLEQELDVITLLRSQRKIKLMNQALLNQKARMLLRFQRKNLVETSSSSSDSDDNQADTLKLMENQNPMLRLIVYGKLKRMMMSYAYQKLHTIDRNLIRGIYLRKIKDFKEDHQEKFNHQSLFTRLTGKFLKITIHNKEHDSPVAKKSKPKKIRKRKEIKALESSLNLEDSMRQLNLPEVYKDIGGDLSQSDDLENEFEYKKGSFRQDNSHIVSRVVTAQTDNKRKIIAKQFNQKKDRVPSHQLEKKAKASSIVQAKLKILN